MKVEKPTYVSKLNCGKCNRIFYFSDLSEIQLRFLLVNFQPFLAILIKEYNIQLHKL